MGIRHSLKRLLASNAFGDAPAASLSKKGSFIGWISSKTIGAPSEPSRRVHPQPQIPDNQILVRTSAGGEEGCSLESETITLERFGLICEEFNICTPLIQECLFRLCRPADGAISFLQLLRGLQPAIKGDELQRAAFTFVMYDQNESGELSTDELWKLVRKTAVGCRIEQDLIALVRSGAGHAGKVPVKSVGGRLVRSISSKLSRHGHGKEHGKKLKIDFREFCEHVRSVGGAKQLFPLSETE